MNRRDILWQLWIHSELYMYFMWISSSNDWENVWHIDYNDDFQSKPNQILLDCLLYEFTYLTRKNQFYFISIFLKGYFFQFTANSQSNERQTANETRSSAIASSSNSTRTIIGNVLNASNPTSFKTTPKTSSDHFDGNCEQTNMGANGDVDDDDLASVHLMLEPHLRPVPPDPKSDLSKKIFSEHKQLAKDYLKVAWKFQNI